MTKVQIVFHGKTVYIVKKRPELGFKITLNLFVVIL